MEARPMDDELRIVEEALLEADEALDRAWEARIDLEAALADARRWSARLGRNPQIENASIELARLNGCSPSDSFKLLRRLSQSTNRPISDVAEEILARSVLAESSARTTGRAAQA
jgi:AmiR/NasT family two-component response regulator